jgi:hypothetical protein
MHQKLVYNKKEKIKNKQIIKIKKFNKLFSL